MMSILIFVLMAMSLSFGQLNNETAACPTFQYTNISNYATNRNFQQRYQHLLPPHEAIGCIEVPNGFLAELYASEETAGQVQAVMAFAFDEKGRLWVVETFDYPNNILTQFQGNDHIKILEDTDGDGVADKQTIFAENLNIPQGITFTTEGVLVAAAPHVVLFKDDNGDDIADDPDGEIIYTGFPRNDTHGSIGNLTYGLDNWIHFSEGYNNATISGPNLSQSVSGVVSGPFRMKSDGTAIERVNQANCNSWAMAQNEEGQVFFGGATCGTHTQHSVFSPNRRENISRHGEGHHGIAAYFDQGDWVGSYTAVSNHEIYTSRYFPQKYWNSASFILDGTVHAAHMDFLTPNKSTWDANEENGRYNIMASTDSWSAPIMAKVGPDGALWVADWYNYLYLHNGASPAGAGAAYIFNVGNNSLRDNQHARMYRIVRKDQEPFPILDISGYTPDELIETLGHPTMLYRLHAQRLLLKNGLTAEIEAGLQNVVENRRYPDTTGLDAQVLHALWTLEGFGLFSSDASKWNPILRGLLLHPSHSVRMNVMKAMPKTSASAQSIRDECLVNDENPHVRLQALVALSKMPSTTNIVISNTYRNLDGHSQAAYDMVPSISSANIQPCSPNLHDIVVPVKKPGVQNQFTEKLTFGVNRDGTLKIRSEGSPTGTLKVYSFRGELMHQQDVVNGELQGGSIKLNNQLFIYSFVRGKTILQNGMIKLAP